MQPDEQFSEDELEAAKQQLREFTDNSNFISGIYNYCDRWCERCPMTSRCMVFAQEGAERKLAGGRDAENRNFWRALSKNFAVTQRMIRRYKWVNTRFIPTVRANTRFAPTHAAARIQLQSSAHRAT